LVVATAALVSTLVLARGDQTEASSAAAPSKRDADAALRLAWVNEVRAGRDVRPAYASMLASPGAGGGYFASEVEHLCAVLARRVDPDARARAIHAVDVNEPAYTRHQEALQQLGVTCASIQPSEGSFANMAKKVSNVALRASDPMLDLLHRLSPRAQDRDRAQATRELLELGPPGNAYLLVHAMLRWSGETGFYVFDGVKYPLTDPEGGPLDGRSAQLLAAADLASCDLGVPCGAGSMVLARNCLLRYVECNEPDYRSAVFARLRAHGYLDLDRGLIGVEKLRARIVQAVRTKDLAVFVKKAPK
jgi:hypothetical protein